MPPAIQNLFTGRVSKNTLLTLLLPLSFVSCFGTLIAAAFLFPIPYHWSVRAISNLTSPHDNPDFHWIPSVGIAGSALLALPFAGYLEKCLRSIAPRIARMAGVAFGIGFALFWLNGIVVPQEAHPSSGIGWIHEFVARCSAAAVILGMFCCCGCALKDRLPLFGGQRALCPALAFCWTSFTLLPLGCLAITGTVLLGHRAGQDWAEATREWFRHTMMWHLAFWEWVGVVLFFAFMAISVLLLPERDHDASNATETR
jgi:hypothetical protein